MVNATATIVRGTLPNRKGYGNGSMLMRKERPRESSSRSVPGRFGAFAQTSIAAECRDGREPEKASYPWERRNQLGTATRASGPL